MMQEKIKQALNLCIFQECKLIPIKKDTKIPAIQQWTTSPIIPFPTLKTTLSQKNYGVVCGTPSKGLWVIDCDSSDKTKEIENLLSEFQIATYEVKTRRGKHFYFKSPLIIKTTIGNGIDIKGQSSYVVGAGSTNGDFTYSACIKDITTLYLRGKHKKFLESLEKILEKKILTRPYLSKNLVKRLKILGTEKSTSEQEFNIILEMITKGYTKKEIYKIFYKKLNQTSHFFKIKNPTQQELYIDNTYKKAYKVFLKEKKERENHKEKIPEHFLLQLPITATEKKILWIMIKKSDGNKQTHLSYREIMKEAAIGSLKTVQKNIKNLKEKKYIKQKDTSIYQIGIEKILKGGTILNTIFSRTLSLNIDSLLRKNIHPVFGSGFLGSSIFFAFQVILRIFPHGSFTAREFLLYSSSQASGYRTLKRMLDLSFLSVCDKRYSLDPSWLQNLYTYASSFAVREVYSKRLQRIRNDRESFQLYNLLWRAYKRKHFSQRVWDKIQFTLLFFGLDISLLSHLLENDFLEAL